MNKAFIQYTLGNILKIMALLFVVPIITAFVYGEEEGSAYVITAIICVTIGYIMTSEKPKDNVFFLREGCVITVLTWVLISFFGGLPFFITGEMNGSFIDSMFESVSGFTTTGATILTDVEVISKCTLIWRSLTHWIGGMGVLVFLLALIPLSGGSNANLMRAESTGVAVGKLAPKIRETAIILYTIYVILTASMVILLLIGKTPFFDAINIAFSTTGTGGFGIKNDSLSSYSTYVQWVTTVFMALSALRFDLYYYLIVKRSKKAFSEEAMAYVVILITSILIIYFDLMQKNPDSASVLDSALASASIMSTTGFATADFNLWPELSRCVLLILTFIGGCTGSTGGGLKVQRLVILIKSFKREIVSFISPRSIKKIRIDGSNVEEEIIRATAAYFSVYIIIFTISWLIVSFAENDLITNFTSVAATFNNVGPGLSMVGPTGNYAFHTLLSKIVLIFDMLAGRLEIFPLIVFFEAGTIKAIIKRKRR